MVKRLIKVLVAEDDEDLAELICDEFDVSTFQVTLTHNGADALEELKKDSFDALVTDVHMPKMNGIDLICAVRSESHWQELPIFIVTAHLDQIDLEKHKELSGCTLIRKPFDIAAIGAALLKQTSEG